VNEVSPSYISSYHVTQKKLKEAPELTENLTFWTVTLMVDQRPRMRRSHWNATILIFTCLIRRSDGSRVSSLISVIGYLGFSYSDPPHHDPFIWSSLKNNRVEYRWDNESFSLLLAVSNRQEFFSSRVAVLSSSRSKWVLGVL
jgi:hypothetical protein